MHLTTFMSRWQSQTLYEHIRIVFSLTFFYEATFGSCFLYYLLWNNSWIVRMLTMKSECCLDVWCLRGRLTEDAICHKCNYTSQIFYTDTSAMVNYEMYKYSQISYIVTIAIIFHNSYNISQLLQYVLIVTIFDIPCYEVNY